MRTTLTLDDDVAQAVARLRAKRQQTLKEIVNQALRAGLPMLDKPRRRRRPFRSKAVSLGRSMIADLDDVAEALALAEGDGFR